MMEMLLLFLAPVGKYQGGNLFAASPREGLRKLIGSLEEIPPFSRLMKENDFSAQG